MNKFSLRQRITITFLLLTFVICTLFSVGMFTTIHSLESGLFNRFFTEHARWLIKRHLAQPLEQDDLPEIESFFDIRRDDQHDLPPYLQNLRPGWHEVTSGSIGLHVYVEDIGTRRYIVAHDQSEFEQREVIIGAVLVVGMFSAMAFAWWASSSISGRVIEPLSKLAGAIEHQQPVDANAFANDEVGNLARAFVHYKNTLEDFLKRERFFTSDASHELRTPLMAAGAAIELLLGDETDARRHATLQRANAALSDMRNLVDAFLALSRNARSNANSADVSAAWAVQQEIAKLAAANDIGNHKGIEEHAGIHCDIRQDFFINCPPTLLSVVIGNLLRNAFYYAGDGSVNVVVNAWEIIIADTGSGIAPALIDAVFHDNGRSILPTDQTALEIKAPLESQSERKIEGNGLGLFIVKRICDHCNWPISVISNRSGTTFTLRFVNAFQKNQPDSHHLNI